MKWSAAMRVTSPAARNLLQEPEKDEQRTADVDEHLDDVGPDDRRDPAADGVDDHRGAEHDHRPRHRHLRDHRDHERRRKQPDAVGKCARHHEDHRGNVLHRGTEAAVQELVGGEQLTAEIRRDEERAHEQPPHDVAGGQLQERHVAGIRAGGARR